MLSGKRIFTALLMLIAAIFSFSLPAQADESKRLGVTVTIETLQSMVETIGGDHVAVTVMVPAGTHPRTFEPTPKQMVALESSAIYISMGLPHEDNWLPQVKSARPDMPILNMIDHVTTRTKDGGSENTDPHIWLGPSQLRAMAESLRDTLIKLAPKHEAEFTENAKTWLAGLDAVDEDAKTRLAPYKGKSILVFHPAFGYLTDAYGLKQLAIEQKGMEPGPKMIAASIKAARDENIKTIFVQAQFSEDEARTIASEIDGKVVRVNPLAPNLLENLKQLVTDIEASFRQ